MSVISLFYFAEICKRCCLILNPKMGSQLRAPKRKNAPGTPPLGSHKLRKVARIERTATLGTIARPIQQTVVC